MGKKEYLKISMSNLGPIKEAEIELRPLTIFIGPNNTGKTWAAYSVAAAFELIENFLKERPKTDVLGYYEEFLRNLKKKENHFEIDVKNILEKMNFEEYISKSITSYFSKYMLIDSKSMKNTRYNIEGLNSKIRESFFRKRETIELRIDGLELEDRIKKTYPTIEKSGNSFLYKIRGLKNKKEVSGWFYTIMIFELYKSIYDDILVFPSERTSLSYISDLFAYNALENIDKEEEMFRAQKPIRDYVRLVGKLKNFEVIRKNTKKAVDIIEKEILYGKIGVEKRDFGDEIEYYFKDGDLGIHATSSLVKSLSILDLYIKNYGYENKLFIIDETTMNLHPEAQVKFIELISILVNNGAHFILTAHTPYVVDHLINLMEASKSKNKNEIKDLFFLKDKKAFISPNKVAVYEFTKEGKVKDILDRKEITINWETFSKISEKISNIYFKI